jgi:hypothetical protein
MRHLSLTMHQSSMIDDWASVRSVTTQSMKYPAMSKVLKGLQVNAKCYPTHCRSSRIGSSWSGKYLVRCRKACLLLREVPRVQISYILSFRTKRSVWL